MKGSIKPGRVKGSHYLRVELPPGADGKRRQRRETVVGTKRDAEAALRDLLREVETGQVADDRHLTFGDVCTRWLEAVEHRVAPRAFEAYRLRVEGRIRPALGGLRAEALRPAHVESALAAWLSGGRADKRKDRAHPSRRTIYHTLGTLRAVCAWGVEMGLLARNPAAPVRPPRVEAPEMRALDPAGIARLFAAVRATELEVPVVLAVATGVRRGELLALRWGDVDLESGRLSVRRSVENPVKGERREKPPKTARSARTVSLPAFAVEALRRYRAEQAERRLLLGLGADRDGVVFTRLDESPWTLAAFGNAFVRAVKRAGVRVRLHDLRHSYATLALAAGVDLKTVSSSLGHASIALTGNTYLHAVESLERDSAARLDALLGPAATAKKS